MQVVDRRKRFQIQVGLDPVPGMTLEAVLLDQRPNLRLVLRSQSGGDCGFLAGGGLSGRCLRQRGGWKLSQADRGRIDHRADCWRLGRRLRKRPGQRNQRDGRSDQADPQQPCGPRAIG